MYGKNVRLLDKDTGTSVENEAKQTLHQCRESGPLLETKKAGRANLTKFKTSFEILTEGRKGNR
jgi:hypothetical protein